MPLVYYLSCCRPNKFVLVFMCKVYSSDFTLRCRILVLAHSNAVVIYWEKLLSFFVSPRSILAVICGNLGDVLLDIPTFLHSR